MPTIGNTTKPTSGMVMTGLNNQNQVALRVTMGEAGDITKVGAWMAGNGSAARTRVCVWNNSGNLLGESAEFNAPGQSLAQGNTAKEEHDLLTPVHVNNGQVIYIGFSSHPSDARQWGVNGSGTHYRDTSSGVGNDANFGSFSNSIGAYAEYSTDSPPAKPTQISPKGANVHATRPMVLVFDHNATDGDPMTGYDLQVDSVDTFASPDMDVTNSMNNASGGHVERPINFTANAGTRYYWRCRTRDKDGVSAWSNTSSWIQNTVPTATKVAPLAGGMAYIWNLATDLAVWTSGGAHAKPRFQWAYADPEQAQAQFQVKVWDTAGTGLLYDSGPINGSDTTYDAPWALIYNTVYQWSVEVYDGLEWSVLAKSTFKVKWAQGIYETGVIPASTQWAFSSVKAGNGQVALLYATATGVNGAGRSAWVADIGGLIPAARLNVMVRLAAQTGVAPSLTSMKFSYLAGAGIYPDNWSRAPSATGWSLSPDIVRFGSHSLKCVVDTAVDHAVRPYRAVAGLALAEDHMPVKGATTYVFSAYVKTDDFRPQLTGSNKIALEVYAAGSSTMLPNDPGNLPEHYETQNTAGKGDRNWQRLHYVFTTPADVDEVDVFVKYRNLGPAATGDVFYVDGAQLESGQVVTAWSPGQIGAGAAVLDVQGVQVDAQQGGVLRLQAASGGVAALSTDPAAGAMRFTDFLRIERLAATDKIIEGHTGTQPHFDIQRDGKLTWRNPADGSLLASLGIGGGVDANSPTLLGQRLEVPSLWAVEADDVRNGNAAGTLYPGGFSWFEIANSTAVGWPVADARGIVLTFRKANSPIIQLWMRSGSVAQPFIMYGRAWNQGGSAWRAWVQAA